MKAVIVDADRKEVASIELPAQFNEDIRPDIIRKAVHSQQLSARQKYGTDPDAGQRHSAYLSKRRRKYRGTYGIGQSRTPRKVLTRRGRRMYYVGAVAPQTVGGRRAHPPKAEKNLEKKMSAKETLKALRSAISATIQNDWVQKRHSVPEKYPIIIEKSIENFSKTKDIKTALQKLGLEKEIERCKEKSIRSGKGKARNRKYRTKKGPLIVVAGDCKLIRAARNIPGIDIAEVSKLDPEMLAPGAVPGRLTLWTQPSIEKMEKKKLFLR